jgi:uncharacterized protein YcbK (DUF882 family)
MAHFTRDELLKGRDIQYPLTQEMEDNLAELMRVLELVREAYGSSMVIDSGYRPTAINAAAGGATHSAHMMCQAADIADSDGKFSEWALSHLTDLQSYGIKGIEDKRYTPTWLRIDIRGAASGNLVFIPYPGTIKH